MQDPRDHHDRSLEELRRRAVTRKARDDRQAAEYQGPDDRRDDCVPATPAARQPDRTAPAPMRLRCGGLAMPVVLRFPNTRRRP